MDKNLHCPSFDVHSIIHPPLMSSFSTLPNSFLSDSKDQDIPNPVIFPSRHSSQNFHRPNVKSSIRPATPILHIKEIKKKKNLGKYFNDPLHKTIFLDAPLIAVIDTPEFQRLRHIKQLGTTHWVYPGATHTRFEHSIGTSWLAKNFIQTLSGNQPDLGITSRESLLVQLAGLCHDLGHGPFSHAFEHMITKIKGIDSWNHEDESKILLNHLFHSNSLFDKFSNFDVEFTEKDLQSVQQILHPPEFPKILSRNRFFDIKDAYHAKLYEKPFLYEIVANERNSIDVDKFDYLARDAHMTGVAIGFHHQRIPMFSRVIDNQICYYSKEAFNLHGLFDARYKMHKKVYQHHAAKSVEFMITDALCLADDWFGFSKAVDDPDSFARLDDTILTQILTARNPALDFNHYSKGLPGHFLSQSLSQSDRMVSHGLDPLATETISARTKRPHMDDPSQLNPSVSRANPLKDDNDDNTSNDISPELILSSPNHNSPPPHAPPKIPSSSVQPSSSLINFNDDSESTTYFTKSWEKLVRSKHLIRQIQKRKLYRRCIDLVLTPEQYSRFQITKQDLINTLPTSKQSKLLENDFILDDFKLNYGNGIDGPIEKICFYNNLSNPTPVRRKDTQISLLAPKRYQEHYIRVFTRNSEKTQLVIQAFSKLFKNRFGSKIHSQ